MQVYRHMDIGTAKPTAEEQAAATFHLIDVVTPDEPWTLSDFQREGTVKCDEVAARNHIPLIVGGTGLYSRALTQDLRIPVTPPNAELRERWKKIYDEEGTASLYAAVAAIDPEAAARIHVNDAGRLVRVLEVYEYQGRTISELHAENRAQAEQYNVAIFGLNYANRDLLYSRINERVDLMMQQGLLDEVERLHEMGYGSNLNPMRSLGYRHMTSVINGETTLAEAVDLLKRDTRHFARRQLIWFRPDTRIQWIEMDELTAEDAAGIIYASLAKAAGL
jgi:tRNA dimethylallyltransferase